MSKTIEYKLKIDAKSSLASIEDLDKHVSDLRSELNTLSIGSQRFKELQKEIIAADTKLKNAKKSIEGMDFDQVAGEAGKFAGGIGAITGSLVLMGGEGDESLKKLQENMNKGLGIMMGVKGAIEAGTSAVKLMKGPVQAIGVAMKAAFAANPILLVVAAVVTLGVAIGTALIATSDLGKEQKLWNEQAIKNTNDLISTTEKLTNIKKAYKKKLEDYRDRNLTEGEKAQKDYLNERAKQKAIVEGTIEQLKQKRLVIRAEIEHAKAQYEWMQWLMPEQAAFMKKGIEEQSKSFLKLHEEIKKGGVVLETWDEVSKKNGETLQKNIDLINTSNKSQEKKNDLLITNANVVSALLNQEKKLAEYQEIIQNEEQEVSEPELEKELAEFEIQLKRKTADEKWTIENDFYKKTEELYKKGEIGEKERAKRIADYEIALEQNVLNNKMATLSSYASALSSLGNIISQETREGAIISRAGALFQIGVSTAQAIAGATASSASNPANAVTFGAAGVAQYATMIATILANIAQAKQLLSQPLPAFASGGPVLGSGNQDSVNAMLMPGEYVLRKDVVKNIGLENLNKMNAGQSYQKVYVTESDISKTISKMNKVKVVSRLKKFN